MPAVRSIVGIVCLALMFTAAVMLLPAIFGGMDNAHPVTNNTTNGEEIEGIGGLAFMLNIFMVICIILFAFLVIYFALMRMGRR